MYIFWITIICTAVSQVHGVVHCSRNEEIYPYLYIIIHSGGIRYIGGNFFIMKKKNVQQVPVDSHLLYIYCLYHQERTSYSVIIPLRLTYVCKILVHECSTWIFGRHSQTFWSCLKFIEYYEMIPNFNVFHLFSSLQLAN